MRLSVGIMAHASRDALAKQLADSLDVRPFMVWAAEGEGAWETGRRALYIHALDTADWALTLQDDAIPCRDLIAGVKRFLERVDRTRPVLFSLGQPRADYWNVAAAGDPFILEAPGPYGGVAIAVPWADIPDIIRAGDSTVIHGVRAGTSYDRRIARFYGRRRVKCWYPVPTLVDHPPEDVVPSLRPMYGGPPRVSAGFIGRERSALDIDWSNAPVRRLKEFA